MERQRKGEGLGACERGVAGYYSLRYLFAEAHDFVLKQRIAVHHRGNLPVEVIHQCGVHGEEGWEDNYTRRQASRHDPHSGRSALLVPPSLQLV